MNKRRIAKLIIGVVVIGTATSYLLYLAIDSSLAYCYSVDEFVESPFCEILQSGPAPDPKINVNSLVRLAGWVKQGSIVRNVEKMQLDFELAGQKSSVPVRFCGVVPKNFAAGKEVFVEGKIGDNKIFNASKILTRCESKYKVKLQTKLSDSKYKPSASKE